MYHALEAQRVMEDALQRIFDDSPVLGLLQTFDVEVVPAA
jgi:hypothetical protein